MLCILPHRGAQMILAYSGARPAILVAGWGRGGMFLFLLFLHFHSCSSFFPVSLFHLFYYLFYLLSPFLWKTTQNDRHAQRITVQWPNRKCHDSVRPKITSKHEIRDRSSESLTDKKATEYPIIMQFSTSGTEMELF